MLLLVSGSLRKGDLVRFIPPENKRKGQRRNWELHFFPTVDAPGLYVIVKGPYMKIVGSTEMLVVDLAATEIKWVPVRFLELVSRGKRR